MAWKTRTLVLPLLTVHVVWQCLYVSFGENINCWWNKVQSVDWNVYIECQALPPISTQKCHCDLQLLLEQQVQAKFNQCNPVSAHFTTTVKKQDIQNVCTVTCHGQDPASCTVKEGYPPPICSIPLEDVEMNMNCSWPHNLLNPMNFTLHLEDMHGNGVGGSPLKLGVNNSVIIQRAKYNAGSGLRAWLSASNALGSVWSDEVTFDMDAIVQPSAPLITGHEPKPLEILWEAKRDAGLPAQWLCKVQYRRPCDPDWTEDEASHEANFVLEDPVPFTTYTFRVRCWLSSLMRNYVVMSDWSEEYNAKTPPAVPLGKLDVWSVCEPSLEAPTCKILWKEMPVSQAQGKISSYMVRVRLHNGSDMSMRSNRTGYTAEETCMQSGTVMDGKGVENVTSCAPQTCDQEESCFQSIPLKVPITEVKAVSVAASTTQGESIPSFVALPRTDVPTPTVKPKVRGARNELSVSWCVPTWFSERVQEFVVQHKPIKLHRILCLNWVKVNKSQSSIVVKGPLWDYTAYNVSLFAVVNNFSHLLGYSIAYTVQKVPPKVTDLQIMNISSSTVDLTWTPISLNTSPGLILYYLVHLDNGSVVNVSRHMSSVQLRELKPGQHYDVWISAMTEAGEGEKATTSFTTKTPDNPIFLTVIVISILIISCIIVIVWCCSSQQWSTWPHRIPDPNNSSLFKGENLHAQMSSSPFHHSWPTACTLVEHSLKISNVEEVIVSDSPRVLEDDSKQIVGLPEVPEVEQHPAQLDEEPEPGVGEVHEQESGGFKRTSSAVVHRRKDYSQVIDSDYEQGGEEDEEWDEQPHPSDYERHFLPCM